VQKKCSKTVDFLQFLLKTRSFLQKNAKKCKFLLIFTLIFTPKTEWSYKITLFTIANHPNFQNFPQKPLISQLFSLFSFPFSSVLCYLSSVFRPPVPPVPASTYLLMYSFTNHESQVTGHDSPVLGHY